MFCPQCRAEFRDGFDRCNECDLPLVTELPSDELESDEPLESVFMTRDSALLPVLRSLLDSSGIPYILQGEEAMGMLPLSAAGGLFGRTGIGTQILVPASRVEEAKDLLADTSLQIPADDSEDDGTDTESGA